MSTNNLFQLNCWISGPVNHDNSIVIAEQDLPSGLHSLPTLRPIPLMKIFKRNNQPKQLVKAYISELGVITTRENIDWIHLVRLADNCFEQNLLIHWDGDKKSLIGTTIKTISAGEELKAWFPMDLLNFLSIPFLSPINIVHSSNYQCVHCETNFNQPNPLKIHIAFDCPLQLTNYSRNSYKSLPLTSILTPTTATPTINNPLLPTNTNVNLSQSSSIVTQLTHLPYKLSSTSLSSSSPSSLSSSTINKTTATSSSSSSLSSLSSLNLQENVGPLITKETSEPLSNLSPQPTTNSTTTHHVSSSLFGTKEPRSHICVFCGKLYTRKYGLKIHLRTHTGHKPLSCRFCGRPFSDPSNLNKHIRLHSQHHSGTVSSPYKCKKCSKILVRRRDLERHLKSRHKLTS